MPVRPSRRGFTLIELMIVVAIIGILAAIAVPKFADLVRKSKDGATKGNLGAIRSALQIYYAEMEGSYPGDLDALAPKYISEIPTAKLGPYHGDSSATCLISTAFGYVTCLEYVIGAPGGGWEYWQWPSSPQWWGRVGLNCTHTDSKNSQWRLY